MIDSWSARQAVLRRLWRFRRFCPAAVRRWWVRRITSRDGLIDHPIMPPNLLRTHVLGPLTAGKTFADVGGLFGTINETVSIAVLAGAREATMIDIQVPGNILWTRFHERCAELGVEGYHSVVGNLCDDALAERVGQFDVTHCSGVLYHTPDPINAIRNLISITRERFLLSSAVVPNVISNRAGKLALRVGECLLVPALDEQDRAVLREYLFQDEPAAGITWSANYTVSNQIKYGPWWWLFTADTLTRMCLLFDVEIEHTWIHPRSASVLARVRGSRRGTRET